MTCCPLLIYLDTAKKCLIRATISGQTKITLSAVSLFSTHHVPQNYCGNFLEIFFFRYMSLRARESERIFDIAFMTSLTFQSFALTSLFRDPDTICKLQLPMSASFGSSFSSLAAMNFYGTAQFVLGPSIQNWFILIKIPCFN